MVLSSVTSQLSQNSRCIYCEWQRGDCPLKIRSEAGSHIWTSNRVYEELSGQLHVQADLFPGKRFGIC